MLPKYTRKITLDVRKVLPGVAFHQRDIENVIASSHHNKRDIVSFIESCCGQSMTIQNVANRETVGKTAARKKLSNKYLNISLYFQAFLLSLHLTIIFFQVLIQLQAKCENM